MEHLIGPSQREQGADSSTFPALARDLNRKLKRPLDHIGRKWLQQRNDLLKHSRGSSTDHDKPALHSEVQAVTRCGSI